MPSYFPEGNEPAPGDTVSRSLQKINSRLYELAVATLSYLTPDSDCAPRPGDTQTRSLQKINALLNAFTGTGSAGGTEADAGDPSGARAAATTYYNTTDGSLWVYDGSTWIKLIG